MSQFNRAVALVRDAQILAPTILARARKRYAIDREVIIGERQATRVQA